MIMMMMMRVARNVCTRSMCFSKGTRGFCSATAGAGRTDKDVKTAGERVLNDYLCSTSEEEEMRELERVLSQRQESQQRRHAGGDGDDDGSVRAGGLVNSGADTISVLSGAHVEAEAAEARKAAARARPRRDG